jgi:DNA (cytosine-5)-methyltransferase 1
MDRGERQLRQDRLACLGSRGRSRPQGAGRPAEGLDICAYCGGRYDSVGNRLLPLGVVEVGVRVAVHAKCWAAWRTKQREELPPGMAPRRNEMKGRGGRVTLRALDLYCGAGGATRGLKQAGFHVVVGVDFKVQPNYCGDAFVQMDAIEYLAIADLGAFDYIHASPPCQRYTSLRHAPGCYRDADLVALTRKALIATGKPYSIENVPGAPLVNPTTLCGSMFGLIAGGYQLLRHRWFETSFPLLAPRCQHDRRPVLGVYGGHFRDRRRPTGTSHKPMSNVPAEHGYAAMEIPLKSMTTAEISDAIPPAFARYIAEAWLRSLADAAQDTLAAPLGGRRGAGVGKAPARR